MSKNHNTISVSSSKKVQLIDITHDVEKIVSSSGASSGVCYVYTPHTTAAITINENADPDVVTDIITSLDRLFPWNDHYRHREGNSAAHVKASLIGPQVVVPVRDGRLQLGTWQAVFFCEFDGPRRRHVLIQPLPGP